MKSLCSDRLFYLLTLGLKGIRMRSFFNRWFNNDGKNVSALKKTKPVSLAWRNIQSVFWDFWLMFWPRVKLYLLGQGSNSYWNNLRWILNKLSKQKTWFIEKTYFILLCPTIMSFFSSCGTSQVYSRDRTGFCTLPYETPALISFSSE